MHSICCRMACGSSRTRDWTSVPCIARQILNHWATGGALSMYISISHHLCITCTCVHAQSLQSGPSLCSPMNCSPSGFSVHGILQTRILEWVAMFSSRGSSQPRIEIHVSCVSCIAGRFLTTKPPGKSMYHIQRDKDKWKHGKLWVVRILFWVLTLLCKARYSQAQRLGKLKSNRSDSGPSSTPY